MQALKKYFEKIISTRMPNAQRTAPRERPLADTCRARLRVSIRRSTKLYQ